MASRRIYFAGSIRAGRNDAELYAKIVGILRNYGKVLTEHVGDPNLTEKGELSCSHSFLPLNFRVHMCLFAGDEALTDKQIHDRDVAWLTESDGECWSLEKQVTASFCLKFSMQFLLLK